ncbi:MAG: cation:proton antiporter subunit C [Desulfobacula sp.]|nr:cation:proton antiporter subunit C [Desulfobacula sp.]
MDDLLIFIINHYNYWVALILLLTGLYGMISKNNLLKKVISMSIFQSAIILFYISIGAKKDATIPIIEHGHNGHGAANTVIDVANYANPLPHVLMLTAIVVGVATLGVALALIQKINQVHNTIEEDEILRDL